MTAKPWHRQAPTPGAVYVFNGRQQKFTRLTEMWVVECDGEVEVLLTSWGAAVSSLAFDWQITGAGNNKVARAVDGEHRWKVYAVDVEGATTNAEGVSS